MTLSDNFNLNEDERIEWRGRRSYQSQFRLIIIGIITIWFLMGIIFFLMALLRVYSTEYIITNQRIFVKYELYKKKNCEINIEDITDVNIEQGFWDKTLNLGNIQINIKGDKFTEITLFGVMDPSSIRDLVKNLVEDKINVNNIMQKIKKIEDEYDTGKIDNAEYYEIYSEYRKQLSKYKIILPPRKKIVEKKDENFKEKSGVEICVKCGTKITKTTTICKNCGHIKSKQYFHNI